MIPADLAALLALATRASEQASRVLMAGYRSRPAADHKGRIDLVTEFDRRSEALLRDVLTEQTPFSFLGEEDGAIAGRESDTTWIVDPLDGTTNFVHGHPFFCVSIGLVERGAPILGVVAAPALGTTWAGGPAIGATRNGERCSVSPIGELTQALLATGFPYDFATGKDDNVQAFVAMKRRCQEVRRCGSAAIDLCMVADGTFEGYWERKLKPWDFAAGAAIVEGAGGRTSDFDGTRADLATGRMLASNGRVHDAMIEVLASEGDQ